MIYDQKESDKKRYKFASSQRSKGRLAINRTETSDTQYFPRTIYNDSKWCNRSTNYASSGITPKTISHNLDCTMSMEASFSKPCLYCDDKQHYLDRCDHVIFIM